MLKIIFAGTHEVGLPCLEALIASSYEIVAVYTQPDRPTGRGQKITMGAIKQTALKHQISVFQPLSLRPEEQQETLRALHPDLMIVIGYGLLLPQAVLDIPRYGCWNAHISLLPRWRGAAPAQRALLAGDRETGVTLMQMNAGLDTGDILKQERCYIEPTDTTATLHTRLAQLSAHIVLESLPDLLANRLHAQPQNNSLATHAPKIAKEEANIEWSAPAIVIDRRVRAFNPWPVAFTHYQGQLFRIWKTEPLESPSTAKPGTILQLDKNSLTVATGEGLIKILELQIPGGKPLTVHDFLNSRKDFFERGSCFG